MGSVTMSEVLTDAPHFPHSAMLATSAHGPYQSHTPPSTRSRPTSSTRPDSTTSSHSLHSRPTSGSQTADRQPHSPRVPPTADSTQPPPASAQALQQASNDSSTNPSSASSTYTRSTPPSPKRIKIKDLNHIQSFVQDEDSIPSRAATGQFTAEQSQDLPQYEISGMPVSDVIEMVAGLLTKITTTNDDQAERLHKDIPSPEYAAKVPLSNSVLAFHGKNVPTISIMSYLGRIQKYCPATYEVFLSLLVYFDRITEKINATSRFSPPTETNPNRQAQSQSNQQEQSAALRRGREPQTQHTPERPTTSESSDYPSPPPSEPDPLNLEQLFVVDSFNIHRLIIAGVTCASKFFSDVFYTNSRYAKVGGLPLPELNNLEIQFLLLNDFRLSIPVEELEAYGTMLVEFYAREVIAQRHDEGARGAMQTESTN